MNELQTKIFELRKELREDYTRLCKKYYEVIMELDAMFDSISKGLDKKEMKGGETNEFQRKNTKKD